MDSGEQQMMLPVVGCDLVSDQCRGEVVEVFSSSKGTGYAWGFSHLCQACLEKSRKERTEITSTVIRDFEHRDQILRANPSLTRFRRDG